MTQQIINEYQELIKKLAWIYGNKNNLEDLIQEGYLGLYSAYNNYDPSKGSFKNFATIAIKGYMMNYFNSKKSKMINIPKGREEKFFYEEYNTETHSQSYEPILCIKDDIEYAINKLPDDLKELIEMYFFQGLNYTEIAKIKDEKHSTIYRRIERALRTMREEF